MKANDLLSKLIDNYPIILPQRSYGQNGEDLIIDRLMAGRKSGFYVDVGSHHPIRFSNTYKFYKRGWRGLNIDAMPGSAKHFQLFRGRDISIECGVAEVNGVMTYYMFNEPALNTFSFEEAGLKNQPPYKIIGTKEVRVERLDFLLQKYLPKEQDIDFLSLDVEGMDYEVLRSNDWSKYRPELILAETLHYDIINSSDCPIVRFLVDIGYEQISKAYNTTFFRSCY